MMIYRMEENMGIITTQIAINKIIMNNGSGGCTLSIEDNTKYVNNMAKIAMIDIFISL